MTTISTILNTAAAPASDKPPIVLHMMQRDDILNAQVYGPPGIALCGFEFVPASGAATSGVSESRKPHVCDRCDVLFKAGVRTPPKPD